MAGFVYGERKPMQTFAEQESEFWQNRNADITKRNREKAKDVPPVPSMSDVYRSADEEHNEQLAQQRAQIEADPYSTQSFINRGQSGLSLPRNDPYSKRMRWNQINPGVEYPGDDKVL